MFAGSITIFEMFGLKIRVNISWAFIAILLAWSLAQGYFPMVYSGLPVATYWWMGIAGVIGLFGSVILHEVAHSLVARAYGMEIKGITLWLLGGVAELGDEPPTPAAEFWMAIAGPAMSFALAISFYFLAQFVPKEAPTRPINEVVSYLALVNLILGVFNLIPAFPMDGGRVLRAYLWHTTGSAAEATRTAARLGSWFGLGLILLGLSTVLFGLGFNGLWWVVLGMFIRFAADAALYQSQVAQSLRGKSVMDFMTKDLISVPLNITAREFRDAWVLRYHHKVYPVGNGEELSGVISTRHISAIDPDNLERHKISEMMDPLTRLNTIAASATAEDALKLMQTSGNTRLLVTEDDGLVGIIALKDLLRVITVHQEMGV